MHNYFMHPSSLRNREKLIAMRIEERAAGYGVLIMILELLRDAPNYALKDNPKNIAFTINELDYELVDRVIHNYELFQFDENGNFTSPWLKEALDSYTKSAEKRIERARKAANARHHKDDEEKEEEELSNAQAMPKQCLSNAKAMQEQCSSNANAMLSDATFYNKSINKQINKINKNKLSKLVEYARKFDKKEEDFLSFYKDEEHVITDSYRKMLEEQNGYNHETLLLLKIADYFELSQEDTNLLAWVTDSMNPQQRNYQQVKSLYEKCKRGKKKPDLGINYILTSIKA